MKFLSWSGVGGHHTTHLAERSTQLSIKFAPAAVTQLVNIYIYEYSASAGTVKSVSWCFYLAFNQLGFPREGAMAETACQIWKTY